LKQYIYKNAIMKKTLITLLSLVVFSTQAQTFQDELKKAKEEAKKEEKKLEQQAKDEVKKEQQTISGGGAPAGVAAPSNNEIIEGLKEALKTGTNKTVSAVSVTDGYFKNARLFIPFPPEAIDMKNKLTKLGLGNKVTEFETSLNRAAEKAAEGAAAVFIGSITRMSVSDGMAILKGADTAATHYLRQGTTAELYTQYKPVVKDAIAKVKVTQYWDPLVKKYNKIPGVKKQNPDLEDYVTRRAMAGLFLLVADEEVKIRKDPVARVNDILKKVFEYADTQKGK
jgi:hypothetical protein